MKDQLALSGFISAEIASCAVIHVAHRAGGTRTAIVIRSPNVDRSRNPSTAQNTAPAASQISVPISTMAPMAARNPANLVLGEAGIRPSADVAGEEFDAGCDISVCPEGAAVSERNGGNVIAARSKFKMPGWAGDK